MDPSPQVPAEVAGHMHTLRWRPFAWWRTALAVVPICARIVAALPLFGRPQGGMAEWPVLAWLYLTVPVLFLALPSAFIASYAYRRSRGAVYTALGHDAIILAMMSWATVGVVRNDPGFDHARVTYAALSWIGAGAAFGAEAAYLLRVALRWRFAWPALAVLVAGATSAAVAMPPVIAARRLAHVRPLLRYANAHWFAVPPDAKIIVGRLYAGARHIDTVDVLGEDAWWTVPATHDRTGRWVRAGTGADPEAFPESPARASTPDQALRLLAKCGVADQSLRLEKAVTDPFTKQTTYRFRSSLAEGSFEVSGYGRIRFLWEQPLELHEPSGRR